jgi:hypothetical protein
MDLWVLGGFIRFPRVPAGLRVLGYGLDLEPAGPRAGCVLDPRRADLRPMYGFGEVYE